MDFVRYINTPVGRNASNRLSTSIKLTRGRLTGGSLYFPSGPAGTLHFLARIATHQILPFNPGESLRLDDCIMPFYLGIDLLEPPFEIQCVTWNDSVLYDHVLTVSFSLTPKVKKKFELDAMIEAFAKTQGYKKS